MRHHADVAWEAKLKSVFDRIDDDLESAYGTRYPLHPARPRCGRTANKEHDGLFNVHASFSAGYGSTYGAGYLVQIRMVTLARVPRGIRQDIEEFVGTRLRALLREAFPKRKLTVSRDHGVFKIHGDLSLGTA